MSTYPRGQGTRVGRGRVLVGVVDVPQASVCLAAGCDRCRTIPESGGSHHDAGRTREAGGMVSGGCVIDALDRSGGEQVGWHGPGDGLDVFDGCTIVPSPLYRRRVAASLPVPGAEKQTHPLIADERARLARHTPAATAETSGLVIH